MDEGPPRPDPIREGIRLFNEGFFFEAHEILEDAWHVERGEPRLFLQGLIQLCAGFHHFQNGNLNGALQLLQRGMDKMRKYPDHYLGFDAGALLVRVEEARQRIERVRAGAEETKRIEFPKIELEHESSGERSAVDVRREWMTLGLGSLPSDFGARIERTFVALEARGFRALFVADRNEALAKVLGLIPKGSAVAHGTSTTLIEIGLVDLLRKPDSGYRYLNLDWQAEDDAERRRRLRANRSVESDYFLGSVQAICETGEVIGADASGSRQAFYAYGPPHVIWVAGINKLVPDLEAGLRRVRGVALPQEDRRMKSVGAKGSYVGKLVIYERENPGRITLILVGESLGF